MPAAMPGLPLLTLFSSCVLHMAHCASDATEIPETNTNVKKPFNSLPFMNDAYTD